MINELTKDWQWLSFLVQYCTGRNIGKAFCEDVKWWALGIAALAVVLVAWWIWEKIAKAFENWNFRRLQDKIADAETMKEHVWAGHDAHLTSDDQRATRKAQK